MTENQSAAYMISQSVCALIEAMGMQAENQNRLNKGHTMAYGEEAFNELLEKYGIHHNAIISLFHGV